MLCLSMVVACKNAATQSVDKATQFQVAIQNQIPDAGIDMEVAIFSSIPFPGVEDYFVYVFDASCSACIALALDCYKSYLAAESAAPFLFLSKSDNMEIFRYYYKSLYNEDPSCYFGQEAELLYDGIYSVVDGTVVSYSGWRE